MRPIFLLSVLVTLMSITGCTVKLPAPPAGPPRLTILGEFSAEDTFFVRAGRSYAIQEAATPIINGIAIRVKDSSTGTVVQLQEHPDALVSTLLSYPYTNPTRVRAGTRYVVNGSHPDYPDVHADVFVPTAFTATEAGRTNAFFNGDSMLRVEVRIDDPLAADRQYVLEATGQSAVITGYFTWNGSEYLIAQYPQRYDSLRAAGVNTMDRYDTVRLESLSRMQMYTEDPITENAEKGPSRTAFNRSFLQGRRFGGSSHTTHIYLRRRDLYDGFGRKVLVTLRVKSVAKDYYDYLREYERSSLNSFVVTAAQPNLPGNVEGGYGMIGGVFTRTLRFVR